MRSAWWYSDRSLGVHGSLQLLNSSHVRERDKALVASWLVVSGTFFSLGRLERSLLIVGSVVLLSDGHLFEECAFPPLVEIRENPEFHMREDKAHWPRCLLWHFLGC